MIRKLLMIAVAFCCFTSQPGVWAQSIPALINYQGKLVDASGVPLGTANRDLTISIYDAPTGGNKVYGPQAFLSTPVVNGYYNLLLGPSDTANPTRNILDVFGSPDRYLEVTIATTVMSPRQRILSAPFAIQSSKSTLSDGVKAGAVTGAMLANDAVGSAQIAAGAVNSSQISDNGVTASEISAGAVGTSEIADGAVQTSDIQDGSIVSSKFNASAVAPRAEAVNRLPRVKGKETGALTVPQDQQAIDYPGAKITGFPLRANSAAIVRFSAKWDAVGGANSAIQADLNGNLNVTGATARPFRDQRYHTTSGGPNVGGVVYAEVYVSPTSSDRTIDVSVSVACGSPSGTTGNISSGLVTVTEVLSEQIQN